MNHKYALGFLLTMSIMSPVSTIRAAESSNILISEIAWAGSEKSTADEWIEFKNLGSGDIDISGWSLTGAGTSGSAITIPNATSIGAGSAYLIANYAITDTKTALIVIPNLVTTAVSIPNTGINITLLDSGGGIIDSLVDPGTPNFGSSTTFSTMKRDLIAKSWFTESESINVTHINIIPDSVSSTSSDDTLATSPATADTVSETDPISNFNTTLLIDTALIPDPVPMDAFALSALTATDATPPTEPVPDPSIPTKESSTAETIPAGPDSSIDVATLSTVDSPPAIDPVTLDTTMEISQSRIEVQIAEALSEPPIVDIDSTNSTPEIIISESSSSSPTTKPYAITSTEVIPVAIDVAAIAPIVSTSIETSTDISASIISLSIQPTTPVAATPIATAIFIAEESDIVVVSSSPPKTSSVSIGSIIINELLPSPSTGNDEWIELKNITNSSISLIGLTIVDASGKVTELTGSIVANSYAVIPNPNGNLNNDSETVTLMNGSITLDSVSYGNELIAAPKKDFALALVNGSWTVQQSTPAFANPIVIITPIIPTISPTLYANNTTLVAAEQTANTANSGQSFASTSTSSSHTSYVVAATSVVATAHSITLETGDVKTIKAKTPLKKSVAKTVKPKTHSAAKKNAKSKTTSIRSVTLDEIEMVKEGTSIKLEGIVVALPGILGKRSFFIDGLEIYQGTGELAAVHTGDRINIIGRVSILSDRRRVNIKEGGVTILDNITPIIHDYSKILPYGSLVKATGTVSARDGNAILLKMDDATIKIILGNGLTVPWANFAGVTVSVIGILKHGNNETIVLRSAEDIAKTQGIDAVVVGVVDQTNSSSGTAVFLETLGILVAASAGIGAWIWYSRPKIYSEKLILQQTNV